MQKTGNEKHGACLSRHIESAPLFRCGGLWLRHLVDDASINTHVLAMFVGDPIFNSSGLIGRSSAEQV